MSLPRRPLGASGIEVPVVGLGCMGMSAFYATPPESQSLQTLRRALELGVVHWDTAEIYGPFANEELLAGVLAEHRDQIVLATKFGIDPQKFRPDGRPETVKRSCDGSLSRLGVDHIDLYYQHRPDPDVPVEETMGALAELVEAGKIRAIGLSECSADTLRRAHAVHPVAAYQGETSLWTRVHDDDVHPTCQQLGITYVAYSPLGRGFLTGQIASRDDLADDDWRKSNPRFSEENFAQNLALVQTVRTVAERHGATPAQVALAWVLSRPHTVAIPGTTKPHRVEENARAAELQLTAEDMAELDGIPEGAGARYG